MRALPLLVLTLVGCNAGPIDLFVDVRTDFVPGVEFAHVTTELLEAGATFEDGAVDRTIEHDVDAASDYLGGVRVAELLGVETSPVRLRVRLVDQDGRQVVERVVLVRLGHSTAVTLVLTRDCADVTCPPPEDPARVTCVGGVCADPGCSVESPESCPPAECVNDADCPAPSDACAEARCADSVCFEAPRSGACGSGLVCHPNDGCVLPPAPPAGRILLLRSFTAPDAVDARSVALTASGGVFVGGVSSGPFDPGGGRTSTIGFVGRYDAEGNHEWSTTDLPWLRAISASDEHVVGAGHIVGADLDLDLALVTLDADDGTELMRTLYEGSGVSAAYDADMDGVMSCACGWNHGDVDFATMTPSTTEGQGGPHFFCVATADHAHAFSLDTTFADPRTGIATTVEVLSDRVIVGGSTTGPEAFGGPPLEGGFLTSFARADGAYQWSRSWAPARAVDIDDLAEAPGGALFVVGTSGQYDFGDGFTLPVPIDGTDVFAARIDATDGSFIWARSYPDAGFGLVPPIIAATADGVYIANVVGADSTDIVVRALDSADGEVIRQSHIGAGGDETPTGLAVDADGRIFLTGNTTADIPSLDFTHVGELDAFLVRIDP